jgi:adenine-specific DNA methylase
MSQESGKSASEERKTLPIEKGYPIEQVNDIVDKENQSKRYYRPLYTMHKWWARRLGSVFRTISLYTLIDDPTSISVHNAGSDNQKLDDFSNSEDSLQKLVNDVDLDDPESLWQLYNKDVRVEDKRVLDPFMGGGTSLIEASRFGASVVGNDLNPVAWFTTKKELEAGKTDVGTLEDAFDQVESQVKEELTDHYTTECPECERTADVMYYLWVTELDCTTCSETVSLFKDYRVAKGRYGNKGEYNILCPDCESIFHVDDWRSECECDCGNKFVPAEGPAKGAEYSCTSCGQQYSVMDAGQEQGGYGSRMYAIEYYCPYCDDEGRDRSVYKGYKQAEKEDIEKHEEAVKEWEESDDLESYVPSQEVPLGILTDSTAFEGSIGGGHNLLGHGYDQWTDIFDERQLLCLSKLLSAIDDVEDQNAKEYLLLALSDSLMFSNTFTIYNRQRHNIEGIFKTNSFKPQKEYVENNVWGTEYGRGTFLKSWKKVLAGVEWAKAPVERYIEDGSTKKTEPFNQPVGEDHEVLCGDMRKLEYENEFDAVLTDPPYYNNVIYSELSNFFYAWQRLLLKDEYEDFESDTTPRADSIVANPAEGKDETDFEEELFQSFSKIHQALKQDGVLAFTYHHSDAESWGELLGALCEVGFEVTATYPVTADTNRATYKLNEGESVDFDIIIVARPAQDRQPISWNSLRRNIYRTAQKTRKRLEENRELSRGDIGVVEMGRCFHEYSKHHGKVERAGETMTAKEVVDEIYGVIQHGSDIGEIDVFLDLLETPDASFDDLNKLSRGTSATPKRMEDMRLYRMDDGFKLGTWDDETRIAYIQSRVDSDEELTDLDKAQFLRYRWEHGKSVSEYLSTWEITNNLRELCEGLADATGDDTYRNILESRLSDY